MIFFAFPWHTHEMVMGTEELADIATELNLVPLNILICLSNICSGPFLDHLVWKPIKDRPEMLKDVPRLDSGYHTKG